MKSRSEIQLVPTTSMQKQTTQIVEDENEDAATNEEQKQQQAAEEQKQEEGKAIPEGLAKHKDKMIELKIQMAKSRMNLSGQVIMVWIF